MRVVLAERTVAHAGEPTLRDVSEALIAVYGTDFGIHSPAWISRFTDMTRQAAVKSIEATYDGVWELPAVGAVNAPIAVLVRPDGYVAWAVAPDAT